VLIFINVQALSCIAAFRLVVLRLGLVGAPAVFRHRSVTQRAPADFLGFVISGNGQSVAPASPRRPNYSLKRTADWKLR
jgi:hypothetical protein